MTSSHDSSDSSDAPVSLDGFDVLDACHRQTVFTLGKLAALVTRLASAGPDAEARRLAAEIIRHFSITVRRHHEDEEQHVFPTLLASGDPEIVQAVLSLQQDHRWLHVDWAELSAPLEAVAAGRQASDLDALREGVEVFTALSHQHIALEESCVYPQARARLSAGVRRQMGRDLAARLRDSSARARSAG